MDPEIQARIERLYENESLTDNLSDAGAKALLGWAEAQLRENTNEAMVTAAVGFANTSASADTSALLAQAQTFLKQELHAQETTDARPVDPANPSPEPPPAAAPEPKPRPALKGASGTAAGPDPYHNSASGAPPPHTAKRKRRVPKRKS